MPTGMTGMNSMGQVDDGSFSKYASQALQAIAEMYKMSHIAQPGGPLASQLQMLMDAVADTEAEYMGAGTPPEGDPMAAAPDSAVPMDGDEMLADQEGMDPMMGGEMEVDPALEAEAAGPPPTTWDGAGDQLETMLQAANARKRPM